MRVDRLDAVGPLVVVYSSDSVYCNPQEKEKKRAIARNGRK